MACSVPCFAQNPHGDDLTINCAACHSPAGWEIAKDHWSNIELHIPTDAKASDLPQPIDSTLFHHNQTDFELTGQHAQVDCRQCHETLVFAEAQNDCISCHVDVHQMTVGSDCARCHSSENWLVDNITELHQENGFPLLGVHATASCFDCHNSETAVRFDRIGNDCINCHLDDYNATTNPNHEEAGFSTNCIECHSIDNIDWSTETVDHSFFPLEKGHEINECAQCHLGGDFANTPTDCFECHQTHFEATTAPDHQAANFVTDCATCHTIDPGWMPAEYVAHDADHFPIYSGAHQGTWNECAECHTNSSNYAEFTCVACHLNPETDDGHNGVSGYVYENTACLACHPNGDTDGSFDHDDTSFPLTGAHIGVECILCHTNGYAGTPTECAACHTTDFQETTNPDHEVLTFSTDCASCHSTEPEWMPATFANHDDYYALNGAHAAIANDCAACHNGDYNNTPTDCVGCHQADFDNTTNPNHTDLQFSTDCATCHTESEWAPATFDHDGQYFPIYSGEHAGEWDQCVDCHTNPSNYAEFTCVTCHQNPETDEAHVSVDGYSYDSPACLACHPTGSADDIFDHSLTAFPLTGAHITTDCISCHIGGYAGTPTDCAACHQADFDLSINPNHNVLGLSTDCTSCHTTEPDWQPAAFANHNDFYALNGAHATIANDCAACHNGDYNNTPNDCVGCHAAEYNLTTDPPHADLQFSTDCLECHTETAWEPTTYDHDGQYFPIYSGEHNGEWDQCLECHNVPGDYTQFTCITCHANPETDQQHASVGGYVYESNACFACHPSGDAVNVFDHATSNFPLTGEHLNVDCIDCHSTGYIGTPTECAACHQANFDGTTNPNHNAIGLSTDCASCHTTEPDWMPATFANHDDFYLLNGAHAAIANDCASCHNGDYNNTPTDCIGCHQTDYDNTSNPNHQSAQFSTDCASCHSESEWVPSTFDHDAQFFPIYSGAHEGEWNECIDCHTNPNNYAEVTCINCHLNPDTDDEHVGVGGYVYENSACLACHPTGDSDNIFDHNTTSFALTGAHQTTECIDCHSGGYAGTPTECSACHQADFDATTNPNHPALGLPTDCVSCHTTEPDWMPATFPEHDSYYELVGAHAAIANDCAACHNGDYNNTPTTCVGCHQEDYDNTTSPNHSAVQFSTDCASCHDESAWTPASFDHDAQYFPIYSGSHNGEWDQCTDCHNNPGNYAEFTCVTCHTNPETDDEHAGVAGYVYESSACFACHPTGEADEVFDHNTTNFPLTGAHITTTCIECHANGYQGTPTDCAACHQADYDGSTNPSHTTLGLSTDCVSCHTTDPDWQPALFPNHDNYYELIGAHAAIANDCAACHNGNYNNTPNTCIGCHQDDYNAATIPDHQAAQMPTNCLDCHTQTEWTPSTFDHNGIYPLTGEHASIANDCALCHINGNYSNTPNTCVGCHQEDFDQSTNPDHPALSIPTDCATCHTTEPDWMPATFAIHDNYYALNGAHAVIANECATCHNGNYNNTPNTCFGCHEDDYNMTTNPDHQAANFPTDCNVCHSEDAWTPASFDHDNVYPLTGAHESIENDCALCHIGGNYNNTPNTCNGCHQDDYDGSTNPNHPALGLPTDCEDCHTTDPGWAPAIFPIHDNYYVLDGAHAAIANQCADCHNGNYNNTPNTCAGCHQADYDGSSNPNHVALSLPTDCAMCHTTEPDWEPATFPIHDNYYVLDGAHAAIANQCADCHNGNYNNTPNTCAGCHQADYDGSSNPNHVALGIPTDCETCHTTEPDWEPATFPIHDNYWVIDGAHLPIASQCADCHNGNYNNTPNTCVGCHQADYDASSNPNHVALNLPTDCTMCHTTEPEWMPATFPIHDNFWPLNGAHAVIANDCVECHNGNYNNTPNTCFGCHEDAYNSTTNPNHVAAQFPVTCEDCHSEDAWVPSTFDHNAIYPLTGAHQTIENDCALCHIGGNYSNTPNTCEGCHTADYNASINPNHVVLAIPMDCAMCHTTDPDWMPATFPIHSNYWPLNGAHANIANDCAACHNGNYNNTPNTCFGCHENEYNSASNPNHLSAGFPTTCEDCHDENAWIPSTFDHDNQYFPIYSGKHEGEWTLCIECHIGGNYASFSCIDCHEHNNQAQVDDDHQGVSGYSYSSPACYSCHPDGEE